MNHTTRCLAGTNHCHVLHCNCGMLHLTVGPITLRIDPRAGITLHEVLGQALERLAAESHDAQLEAAPARHAGATDASKPAPLLHLASSRGDDLPS